MPRLTELRGQHPIAFGVGSNDVSRLTADQLAQQAADDEVLVTRIGGRERRFRDEDPEAWFRLGLVTYELSWMMKRHHASATVGAMCEKTASK